MTLPNGAHAQIGGVSYRLDEGYQELTGRRCYVHGGRSIFAEQFNITGIPGARNLRQEDLIWAITNFEGEGQVVLDSSDDDSARLFYRSEGLNFRTPGQFSLNRSSRTQSLPLAGPTATTYQGAADMTDVTGTSTTSGTDRRITLTGDEVGTTANYAPGASNVQVDFYLYIDDFAASDVSIAGSAMKLQNGDGAVSGADFRIKEKSAVRTATKSTGTHFTADQIQRVELYAHASSAATVVTPILKVWDVTNPDNPKLIESAGFTGTGRPDLLGSTDNPTTPALALNFTPKTGKDYQFRVVAYQNSIDGFLVVDEIRYGVEPKPVDVQVSIYNQTAGAQSSSKLMTVTANTSGKLVASITATLAAATNYRFRVLRTGSAPNGVWVDQIVATLQSATAWTFDCVEVGLGGRIWAGAHAAAADTRVWRYDPVSEAWEDSGGTVGSFATLNDGAATTDYTVRAMTHSDSLEYILLSGDEIYDVNTSGTDDRYANFTANSRDLVGMAVCQERLIAMAEGTNGVTIFSIPLDDVSINPWDLNPAAPSAGVQVLTITAGSKTPDTNLRQRMCSSPTGARFFVNYGDSTCKVYQVDASGASLTYRELADLGHGVEGKAISYEGGLTFITATYVAESGQFTQSALFYIDANGVLERLGFFREDDPSGEVPVDIEPYQTNLYALQGRQVWRYDLRNGGLFLEYELPAAAANAARSLAVSQDRVFALFDTEVWATGVDETYRQSAFTNTMDDTNVYTSSLNDFGLPGVTKALIKVKLLTYDFATRSPNTRVNLTYQTDQDGTWTPLGTATIGSQNTFIVASEDDPVTFNVLQIRAEPVSDTGIYTPYVLGVIIFATAAEDEEYFDLVLRCEDQDSSDHIDGDQPSGGNRAANLIELWRTGTPTNFIDGYAFKSGGVAPEYLVQIRDLRDERDVLGEGRVVVTLKVVT